MGRGFSCCFVIFSFCSACFLFDSSVSAISTVIVSMFLVLPVLFCPTALLKRLLLMFVVFISAGCLFEKKLCPRDQLCSNGELLLFIVVLFYLWKLLTSKTRRLVLKHCKKTKSEKEGFFIKVLLNPRLVNNNMDFMDPITQVFIYQ